TCRLKSRFQRRSSDSAGRISLGAFAAGGVAFSSFRRRLRLRGSHVRASQLKALLAESSEMPSFAAFSSYYARQLPDLDPWAAIQDRRVAFRVLSSAPESAWVLQELQNWRRRLGSELLSPVSWCPEAWVVNHSLEEMQKDEAELEQFYQCLMSFWRSGSILWQEHASMLALELLDVRPGQRVLDLCAAPGAKATHIAERLRGSWAQDLGSSLLVANELNASRAQDLLRGLRRLAPSPYTVVTQFDGRLFPQLGFGFDRVLCDVPCSCDGMARKPAARKFVTHDWSPDAGQKWHSLQLELAARARLLVKEGGLLVYSTCSLDPVQNEAVVARLLSLGGLELVDARDALPGLKARDGLSRWSVWDSPSNSWHEDDTGRHEDDTGRALGLRRCMRLLPNIHGTAACFAAVLRRTASSFPPGSSAGTEPQLLQSRRPQLLEELGNWGFQHVGSRGEQQQVLYVLESVANGLTPAALARQGAKVSELAAASQRQLQLLGLGSCVLLFDWAAAPPRTTATPPAATATAPTRTATTATTATRTTSPATRTAASPVVAAALPQQQLALPAFLGTRGDEPALVARMPRRTRERLLALLDSLGGESKTTRPSGQLEQRFPTRWPG
ncbi:unnamed protein product, partial [Polarella glacialis]